MPLTNVLLLVGFLTLALASAQELATPGRDVELKFAPVGRILNETSENSTSPSVDTVGVTSPPNAYYVLPIYLTQYNITNKNAIDVIFYLLISNPFNSTVSPGDVISLLQSRNLIIPRKLIDVNYVNLLSLTNTTIIELLQHWTTYVPTKKIANIRQILNGFGINYDDYQEYVMENDNNGILALLKTGNYTEEGIANALTIMQKTEEEMLNITKVKLFENISNLSLLSVLNGFEDELEVLFNESNITLDEILTQPTFNQTFQSFLLSLKPYWVTAVSNNTLVTTLQLASNIMPFSKQIDVYIKNVENDVTYKVDQLRLNNTFLTVTVNGTLESFIVISHEIERNPECYYIIQEVNGTLTVTKPENIEFKENIILARNNGFTHILGSPLICDNRLRGFLTWQNETTLKFATFWRAQSDVPTTVGSPVVTPGVSGDASRNLHVNVLLVIGIIVLCSMILV